MPLGCLNIKLIRLDGIEGEPQVRAVCFHANHSISIYRNCEVLRNMVWSFRVLQRKVMFVYASSLQCYVLVVLRTHLCGFQPLGFQRARSGILLVYVRSKATQHRRHSHQQYGICGTAPRASSHCSMGAGRLYTPKSLE